MPEDLALAWLKEVRDLNAAADEAQARVLEYDRTHDAFHHVTASSASAPARAPSYKRRASVRSQPRGADGRWVSQGKRWTHGELLSYAKGCRCRDCVARWNRYFAALMRRRWKARAA